MHEPSQAGKAKQLDDDFTWKHVCIAATAGAFPGVVAVLYSSQLAFQPTDAAELHA